MKDGCGYFQLTEHMPICDENCDECKFSIEEICKHYNRQFYDCYYNCLVGELPTKEYCKRGCENCTFCLPRVPPGQRQ